MANSPLAFWDYCIERHARIYNMTARDHFKICGSNPHTLTTGEEQDISSLCQYAWYDWCYYQEHTACFPYNQEVLGRMLGPAKGEGNKTAQWVLKANGNVIPCQSLHPLQTSEIHSPTEITECATFDALIERRWGTLMNPPKETEPKTKTFNQYEDDNEPMHPSTEIEDTVDTNGKILNQLPAYDKLLNAEVQIQLEEDYTIGKVKRCTLGSDGMVSGKYDNNPFLNSITYEVEFSDGQVKEYLANLLAKKMLTQVDVNGYSLTLMEGIVDYLKDESMAVSREDKHITIKSGQQQLRCTTAGWKLLVHWKDGMESWAMLADMKQSHPVETAEFTRARGISDQAAFAW